MSTSPRLEIRAAFAWMGALCCVLSVAACDDSEQRPPSAASDINLSDLIGPDASTADVRNVFATGTCEDGAKRECRIYLPSHNDVQPCFVGEQTCVGTRWGECGSGSLVDANDGDAELDPDTISD